MHSLKILFVINSLGAGGTERSLAEMLPGLRERGIDPIIVCLARRQKGIERQVLDQGFDVRFLQARNLASRVVVLRRIIRQEQPDLIHTMLFDSDQAGRLAAAGTGVPVMSSLVNTPYSEARIQATGVDKRRLNFVRRFDSFTARHLTVHLHSVSHAAKAAAVTALGVPPERITVVERGRDAARLGTPSKERKLRARQALNLSPEDEVLVNVGRQEHQKAHLHLLDAMKRLLPAHPRLVLLAAGRTGNASAEIARRIDELGLGDRARFLDHRDDVPEILAAADLFVFPSFYEGLPGAVIEAIALGLPVVASDIPPVREVVEDGASALLVEPGRPDLLAEAIGALLDDRDRAAAFGARNREIFEARFTLDRSVERMAALYRGVAETHSLRVRRAASAAAAS